MKHPLVFATALFGSTVPALAAEPVLTPEHQASLRCSAVFALVAADQAHGRAAALAFPALGLRGKEFFVRTAARVMDEAGADRAQLRTILSRDAVGLRQEMARGTPLRQVIEPCLGLLDLTVPPGAGRTP